MFGATTPINTQLFYMKDRLANRVQGPLQQTVMRHGDQALAQQEHQTGTTKANLLGVDRLGSVLNELNAAQRRHFSYTAYGHLPLENGLPSLLGFNGERPDPLTGLYILGNGHRSFSPVLMRFISPDSLSPFEKGGLNGYVYCADDPLNRKDPTGRFSIFPKGYNLIKGLKNKLGLRVPKSTKAQTAPKDEYTPVGYHGTSREGAKNLMTSGVLENHAFKRTAPEQLVLGEGFYTSNSLGGAQDYARMHLQKGNGGIVLKVKVKNLHQKQSGHDYTEGTGTSAGIKAFHWQTFPDIKVIRHGYYDAERKYFLYPEDFSE